MTKRRLIILILIALDFAAIEFPGILFAGTMVEPRILGMPFLFGYLILCWAIMCLVLLYAWATRWGSRPLIRK